MFSRIVDYMNRDDERFVSFRLNTVPSQQNIAGLQRMRIAYLLFFFLFLVVALIGSLVAYSPPLVIVLLIVNAVAYLDSDTKIKMIKLSQADRSAAGVVS
jgi:hypothetical protein